MNSNWFRHDNDAHSDERCAALIARLGYEGYGMLWHMLERMHRSTDGRINMKMLDGVAWDMRVDVAKLKQMLDTCVEVGLFVLEGDYCYSDRMQRELEWRDELIAKRAMAGRKGGLAKAKNSVLSIAKQVPSKDVANAKHQTRPDQTLPSQAPKHSSEKPTTPERTPQEMGEDFKRVCVEQQWCDQHYADKTIDQAWGMPFEDRDEFFRKVRVMLNSATHSRTLAFAKTMFHEIAGFVNDKGPMANRLSPQEKAARELFREETGQTVDEA